MNLNPNTANADFAFTSYPTETKSHKKLNIYQMAESLEAPSTCGSLRYKGTTGRLHSRPQKSHKKQRNYQSCNFRSIYGKTAKIKTIEKILTLQPMLPTSQLKKSYATLIDPLISLILRLKQMPDYSPNYDMITTEALEFIISEINRQAKKPNPDSTALEKAMQERHTILKDLLKRFKLIKLYIKAHYGTHSNQYKTIRTINFR